MPGTDAPSGPRHSPVEDVLAFASAAILAALGVAIFEKAGLMTGGTAGLALLVTYRFGLPFGAAFVLVNLPFFALALWRMGWRFTAKTAAAVLLLSAVAEFQRPLLALGAVQPAWAALVGGLLLGIALLILFRHRGSLGGFNVLVLFLQERFGWRAGWVQLALDAAILLLSLAVVAPSIVATSMIGALALNLTLAVNHRPGRYMAV
jgi:uncharacterized membrane-anchored protein YitT (DUF2179 family)